MVSSRNALHKYPLGEFLRSSEITMELKSCRVTVLDMDGVAHTVEVTASTLYEPVLPW